MSDDASDKRHHIVANLRPDDWDNGPASLCDEIRGFLKSIKDEGTAIDSGGGDGHAQLWVKVQGVEYYLTVRKSNNQLVREGKMQPTPDPFSN